MNRQGMEPRMKVKVILEPSEPGGYTAIVPVLPGCISEGDTKEEALANIREAIELYLEPESPASYISNLSMPCAGMAGPSSGKKGDTSAFRNVPGVSY